MKLKLLASLTAILLYGLFKADAQIYSLLTTTNTDTPEVVAFRQQPPSDRRVIISMPDSMADSYRSIGFCLTDKLAARCGIAGYAFNNYRNNSLVYMTGDARWVDIYNPTNSAYRKYWFTNFGLVSSGGSMWWERQYQPWGIYSDRHGVFVVKHPGGGDFTLSISTNSGPFTPILATNAYTSDPEGQGVFIKLDLPPHYYRLRVDGQTGNNIILGNYVEDSQASGIIPAFVEQGGIDFGSVTNVSLKIREPIFQGLSGLAGHTNTLLLVHMKDAPDPSIVSRLNSCEAWWSNTMPGAVVAYIGTPFTQQDDNYMIEDTPTVVHNSYIRSVAEAHGHPYVDCMNPSVSYYWMLERGYINTNDVHQTLLGNKYFVNFVWNGLGLYSIGAPRKLYYANSPGMITLNFDRSTNAVYTLQTSTNFLDWESIATAPPTSLPFSTNIPVTDPMRVFRLQLSPP